MSTTDEGNSQPKADFDKIMKEPLPPPSRGSKGGQIPREGEAMPGGNPASSVGGDETDKMMKDHTQQKLDPISEGGGRKRSKRRSRRRKSKRRRYKRRKSTKRKRSTKKRKSTKRR